MSKGEKIPHAVIAAAKEDARFKAIEVRRQDGRIEVVWTKSLPVENQTWSGFASECGLTPHMDGHDKAARKHSPAVVGLDSTGVAFYRISAPVVDGHETEAIVKMQVESLLPLPPDQIEVAWRTSPSHNGSMDITIAAIRKEHLQKFAGSIQDFRPRHVFLSCEGTAKAWQSLFSDRERQALLVSVGAENTQVCLVQNGLVTRAGVLDIGTAGLSRSEESGGTNPPAGAMDRFAHDLQSILTSFGWDPAHPWPLFVLSDGGELIQRAVAALNAAGVPARASVPSLTGVKTPVEFGAREAYEYRTPLGLALIALEKSPSLSLFDRVLEEQEQRKAASAWRSVAIAGAAAALMLFALLVTVYVTDVASARRWDGLVQQPEFQAALQQQTLLRTVARHRPDILGLLTEINAGQNEGVVLDTMHFKKGQMATLTGQAGNMEQMWKFQANLREQKGIKDAEILNASQDTKTKKIKFTITFHYKEFTKKDAAL